MMQVREVKGKLATSFRQRCKESQAEVQRVAASVLIRVGWSITTDAVLEG